VLDTLRSRGAAFFNELVTSCGVRTEDLRQALGALAAAGFAASDGFAGVRALMRAAAGASVRLDRGANFAGRWFAVRTDMSAEPREAAVERQAWTLLRRYGVVFRRLLARETNAAPWRELTRVYRQLEARGEIRGGRFVNGMSGEQFALPDAVERLRGIRRTAPDGRVILISAADPLNLAGIVTAGDRVRAAGRSRMAYRDGVPIAVLEGEFVRDLAPMDPDVAKQVLRTLRSRRALGALVESGFSRTWR
jgi:ATP-dependent Lhr-like helicase